MTSRTNPQHGANMVDRYIGSAFDIVYAVHKELDSFPLFIEFVTETSPRMEAQYADIIERFDHIVDLEASALNSKEVAEQAAADALEYRDTTQQLINEAEEFKQFVINVVENTIQDIEDRFAEFIVASGYEFIGNYGIGIEVTEYNQLLRDVNGEFWRLSGQRSIPYVTTGAGLPEDGAFIPVGDASLRQDLDDPVHGSKIVQYDENNTVYDAIKRNREDFWANKETMGGIYTHYVREDDGTPVAGAECAVYVGKTGVLATGLKDKFGEPLANPFVSAADGLVQFVADPGMYTLQVSFDLVVHTYSVYFADEQVRADLANPDKGAAMVARGVVAVDSIADLLALPEEQRKEGLRYLVKGYHAGSDVGGGEFLYDESRASDYDGGSVLYGFVRIFQNHIVTPEMFGAVGDGVVDDTQALVGVMAFARSNLTAPLYGSRHTVHGIGDYLISSNINITSVNIDMVGRFMLSDDFTDPEAITIGPAGNAYAAIKIRFSVYGNRARQTLHPELIAVDMRHFNWRGANIDITGLECFELLRVRGNCECMNIRVNPTACNHVIVEQDFEGHTADQNAYYIYGSSANLFKQIPETPTSPKLGTSGYLYCACEGGNQEGDDYSIELNTDKFFQVEGFIRTSRNGGIRMTGGSLSSTLSLKNFMLYSNLSTTKKSLLVEQCAAVEGSILIRNGGGVQIDRAAVGGVLNIFTYSIDFGPSVMLGSTGPVYGTYNVHDTQYEGGDVALDLINVRGDVYVGTLNSGGIRVGLNYLSLSVPRYTIINNVPIEYSGSTTANYIDLSVRGGLSSSELANYSYPINGMTAYNRLYNRRVVYRAGWKAFTDEAMP